MDKDTLKRILLDNAKYIDSRISRRYTATCETLCKASLME